MDESFRPDPDIEEIAKAYSLDAVDIAAKNFDVQLDWSEESIRDVEQILNRLHDSLTQAPAEETIWVFAKSFGSYLGEVFRKYHGGTWGMVKLGDNEFPGIRAAGGSLFWPWG